MNLTLSDLGLTSVEDKVVLVSGASSGIGRATVKLLARAGAITVALARNEHKLLQLKSEIKNEGGIAPLIIPLDIRNRDSCIEALLECVNHFGRLDVLVNNAAVGFPVRIVDCSLEDYRRTMETNIDGVFFLTQASLQVMYRQKSGHIIMISSDAGSYGSLIAPIYSTSKHAVEGFRSSLKLQLDSWHQEGVHIRLSNIWPGTVNSDYWGDREVARDTFMTCEEMASFIFQVIACQTLSNISELRVEQFRFD